ncbi:MAG: 50S ribosomal protein L6 [Verrucomicrobiota bacterium]
MSRIGNKPIAIPEKVKVTVADRDVKVEGPKGTLEMSFTPHVEIDVEDTEIVVKRRSNAGRDKAFHGLTRSLLNNMVVGTSEGFEKKLEINGVGFKAALKGKSLTLNLGFSHPIDFPIPEGIKIEVEDNTKLKISGIDKQVVGQCAAKIRSYYPPEPYKGKGVRYENEIVRRKEGKTAQGK